MDYNVKSEAQGSPGFFTQSIVEYTDTVYFAKRILLQNKVQNFTAADVVMLAGLIVKREAELRLGGNDD